MDIKQIRLSNLRTLIDEAGTIAALARKTGTAPAYLSQILNRLPSASGSARTLGDKLARKLENAMGKAFGWMDKDHQSDSIDTIHYVPLLQREDLEEVPSRANSEQMIPVPLALGPRAFAYTVVDESMVPKFHVGEVVVIDPDAQLSDQQYCLCQQEGDKQPHLRQYLYQDGAPIQCRALNPEFPSFALTSHKQVYGRAVYRGEFL